MGSTRMLPTRAVIFLSLLSACICSPVIWENRDLVELIRSGEKTVVDARSDLSREVSGYLQGSILASEYHQEDPGLGLEDVVFVTDEWDPVTQEICSEDVLCYTGSLEPFSDMIIFPQVVSFNSLSTLLQENSIVLVDVRNATELRNPGKIPGSYNVPLHQIPEAFLLDPDTFLERYSFQLPGKDAKNIVLTCRTGRRVKVAISRLRPLGFTQLRSYDGSFKDWVKNGGKVLKGEK